VDFDEEFGVDFGMDFGMGARMLADASGRPRAGGAFAAPRRDPYDGAVAGVSSESQATAAHAPAAARAAEPIASVLREAWPLVPPEERRRALGLLSLMAVGVVLDALGVGLVLPVLALLTHADGGGGGVLGGVLAPVVEPLLALGRERAVVASMLGLLGFYALKAGFRWFLASRQSAFAFGVQRALSRRLFAHLLRRPWSFHLQRNTATLVQSVAHEVDQFAFGVVLPVLVVASEGLVLVAVAALLIVVEPVGGAIALAVLGSAGVLFHRLTSARATALGGRRRDLDRARFRQLQQGFGAVKEAKVLGREDGFVDRFARATDESSRVGRRVQTLRELPRITVEVVAVAGLSALVVAMVLGGRPIESVVPVVGLFIVAVLRVVPSVARLLAALQSIGLGSASVATLREELDAAAEGADTAPAPTKDPARVLALEKVAFVYPGAPRAVFDGVDLEIRAGETVGIVGSSGSGKSTLVDLILGLHAPVAGRMLVSGEDAAPRLRWWQSRIGYVPQTIFLVDDSVRRNIALGVSDAEIDEARLARAVDAAQLGEFVRALPKGLDTVVGERGVRISGGQRQRIGIARALYREPAVLVLDEATSALDGDTERGVMQAIDAMRGSRAIIVVAHRVGTLSGCDRILRAEGGGLAPVSREELGI